MAKFFIRDPDTKEQVEGKIERLHKEINYLLKCMSNMSDDLLKNHATYRSVDIEAKRREIGQSSKLIATKKAQIEKYKIKLTKFKTVHLD